NSPAPRLFVAFWLAATRRARSRTTSSIASVMFFIPVSGTQYTCNCVQPFLIDLKPVEFTHRQRADRAPGIERRARLEHQNDRLRRKRPRPVFDPARDHDKITFAHF